MQPAFLFYYKIFKFGKLCAEIVKNFQILHQNFFIKSREMSAKKRDILEEFWERDLSEKRKKNSGNFPPGKFLHPTPCPLKEIIKSVKIEYL